MSNYKYNKKGFWAGKGFYTVLSLCLVAVGVAAWSAFSAFSGGGDKIDINSEYNSSETSYNDNKDNEVVDNSVPDVEYEQTESTTKEEQVPASTPAQAEYYIIPIDNSIIKGFDDTRLQYSNTFKDMRLHKAIDILAGIGTQVKAAASGTVTAIYDSSEYGKIIEIEHGNGITAKYCGVTDIAVEVGNSVTAGTVIGNVGEIYCESLDEPHLHFEMIKDGVSVPPLKTMGME